MAISDEFDVVTVAEGFDYPTAFAFLPDGRILVAEQSGLVKVIIDGVVSDRPVIDLREIVNSRAERGLLGIAADPKFATNGYIYLLYTADVPGELLDGWDPRPGVLARYTLRGNTADPKSELILLDDYKSDVAYHSLGTLRFAKNGDLFVSLGDGALPADQSALTLRAQDLNNLQGKILRINPANGAGLPTNPFYDAATPRSAKSRIWAYGLRNAFRFSINPQSDLPYAGNVGWFTYEAIDRVTPGANFGWPCVESVVDRPEYQTEEICNGITTKTVTPPEYTYTHDGTNSAIIGGDFNIGSHFPKAMQGNFFFGDYSKGFIRRAILDGKEHLTKVEDFASNVNSPVDIQFGPDGALYYVSIYGGDLRRISYRGSNQLPHARINAYVKRGADSTAAARFITDTVQFITAHTPLSVTFSAATSFDLDKEPLTYKWQFGKFGDETETSNQITETHTYTNPGRYLARLIATDAKGFRDVATKVIIVVNRRSGGAITSPGDGDVIPPGTRVSLASNNANLPLTSTQKAMSSWSVIAYEGPVSRTLLSAPGNAPGTDASFVMPSLTEGARIQITYNISDTKGKLINSDQVTIYSLPEDGYIRNWWLVAGVPERMLDYDALPGGERNFALPDEQVKAQLIHSDSRKINLAQALSPSEHTAGYAFVWIDSPSDRKGLLGMLSDDGIKTWLNGELVWYYQTSRYVPDDTRDLDLPPITLKKGLNALLIKVDQNIGEWALKARVLNPDGSIMREVTLRTDLSDAALSER